jgi:hypothetical protein
MFCLLLMTEWLLLVSRIFCGLEHVQSVIIDWVIITIVSRIFCGLEHVLSVIIDWVIITSI